MSVNAHKWALDQHIGSAGAKFLLSVLGSCADVTGACFPSQEWLGATTDQSVATVQRGLRLLESLGKIYIGPRRVKKNGHAGTRVYVVLHDSYCVEYALSLGFDPAEVGKKRENPLSDEESETDHGDSERQTLQNDVSAENASEENQIDGEKPNENRHVNLTLQDAGAQTLQNDVSADTSLAPCHERSYLKSSPLKSPPASSDAALAEGSWLSDWNRFVDAWTWADGELLEPVRRKFRELSPEERVLAIEHIPAYGAEVQRKRSKPMSARSWIGRKGWEPFVLAAKKHPTLSPGKTVPVIKNSPAWSAWLQARGVRSFPTRKHLVDGRLCDVWDFPTLYPPGGGGHGARAG
jgi:hypothetical protein